MLKTQQASATPRSASDLRGQDFLRDGLADPLTESTEIRSEPDPVREAKLSFAYDKSAMEMFARNYAGAQRALDHIRSFEDGSVKDGARLSDEQKLCLAFTCLAGEPKRKMILAAVFFGDTGGGVDRDHVSAVRGSGSAVTVDFWYPGTQSKLKSRSYTGAVPYTGKDTNLREKRVQAAKNGFVSERGNRVAYGADSFVRDQMDKIEADFVQSRFGAAYKDLGKEERAAAPGYRAALNDYIYDHVLHLRSDKVAFQRKALLEAWVADNPPPAEGAGAWAQRLANKAMEYIITYDNAEFYAKSHSVWRVEDEAAAQILVDAVVPGLQVNYDSDAMSAEITAMPPVAKPEAAVVGTKKPAPETPNVPVVTQNMSALRGHLNTTEAYIGGTGKAKHGLHVGQGCALNQYMDAQGNALWATLGIDGNPALDGVRYRLAHQEELLPYKAFLEAWYALEDAQANDGDAASAKAGFDAALDSFLSACNDGIQKL